MLNFDFLEKCLGIVSPPTFVYDFSRKMCLMVCSVNCSNSLPNCLYFLSIGQYVHCIGLLTRL